MKDTTSKLAIEFPKVTQRYGVQNYRVDTVHLAKHPEAVLLATATQLLRDERKKLEKATTILDPFGRSRE